MYTRNMIDDLRYIHDKDKSDALGLAAKQCQQIGADFTIAPGLQAGSVSNIVFAGMGGSALSALLAQSWPGAAKPFEVVRGYNLPAYVGQDTLAIISSYSGNTEEELDCLKQAEDKGAKIVIMSAGGKLQELAAEKNLPYVQIPSASQPRYATLYSFAALIKVLETVGLVDEGTADRELEAAEAFLKAEVASWSAEIPTRENPAKQLAKELIGKSIVIYAGPLMSPAAYKWKISFNENAKNVAWWGQYPEFNHNEFIGWSGWPHDKPYAVIDLISSFEHPRVNKRFGLSAKLLSGRRPAPNTVEARGDSLLQQLLWTVVFGDFVSIYTALLNGVDPAPVELVEKFKAELSK